jgi:hypothetical protein
MARSPKEQVSRPLSPSAPAPPLPKRPQRRPPSPSPLLSYVSLPLFTFYLPFIYLLFTFIYLYLPLFTFIYLYLPLFTFIYLYLPGFLKTVTTSKASNSKATVWGRSASQRRRAQLRQWAAT